MTYDEESMALRRAAEAGDEDAAAALLDLEFAAGVRRRRRYFLDIETTGSFDRLVGDRPVDLKTAVFLTEPPWSLPVHRFSRLYGHQRRASCVACDAGVPRASWTSRRQGGSTQAGAATTYGRGPTFDEQVARLALPRYSRFFALGGRPSWTNDSGT